MEVSWDKLGLSETTHDPFVSELLKEVNNSDSVLQPNVALGYEARKKARDATYNVVKKDVSKYHSIIKSQLSAAQGETVVLGSLPVDISNTDVVTDLPTPENPAERKMQNILSRLKKGRREAAEKLFPRAEGHSAVEVHRIQKQLRELLTQELKESHRLKTVKSRRNRKNRRRQHEKEQAKLMERLRIEDPEAAEKMREEWEVKRAEARMMLGAKARRQWAKLAKRFGGKDMERTIQAAQKDAQSFKDLLDQMSGKLGGEASSDDGESDEDKADEQKTGIWAMPFMKRAEELREIAQASGRGIGDDFEEGLNHLPDEDSKIAEFLKRKRQGNESRETAREAESSDAETNETLDNEAEEAMPPAPTVENEQADEIDLMNFIAKPKQQPVIKPEEPEEEPNKDLLFNARFFRTKRSNAKINEMEDGDELEDEDDDLLESQQELVRMAFNIQGGDDETKFAERLEEEELKEVEMKLEKKKPSIIPGWGNWSAEGYEDPRVRAEREKREAVEKQAKSEKLEELRKRGLVKVHPSACKPNDKYLITRLPKNFNSKGHYMATMRQGVSDQFVPESLNVIATAPKMKVTRGRVISALKAERKL